MQGLTADGSARIRTEDQGVMSPVYLVDNNDLRNQPLRKQRLFDLLTNSLHLSINFNSIT